MMLFLKPWEPLVAATSIQFFEHELLREIAGAHALYGRRVQAIAKNSTCDDVLYRLDDGTFSQVHLTFTSAPPGLPGWPGHDEFEKLANWMIVVMVPNHIDHFGLW
jgi:hypothetical protein